jgi:hypothetical protein
MPTGSWRARSMLASSYCCPEKPFVLKIRPFGKFPLVWVWWRSRILHRVACTLLDNLDGVLPATMSPVHRCIGTAGTFVALCWYRAQLPWRLPNRRGWDAPELTQPLSSPQLPQPTPRGKRQRWSMFHSHVGAAMRYSLLRSAAVWSLLGWLAVASGSAWAQNNCGVSVDFSYIRKDTIQQQPLIERCIYRVSLVNTRNDVWVVRVKPQNTKHNVVDDGY